MASLLSGLFSAIVGSHVPPPLPKRDQSVMHKCYPPNLHYPEFPLVSPTDGETPEVPAVNVFQPESLLLPSTDYLPTPAQCAVHLELLECFHALQDKVKSDEQIGRWLGFPSDSDPKGQRDQVETEQRNEMKWQAFLELAVQRFGTWWQIDSILIPDNRRSNREVTIPREDGERLVVSVDVQIQAMAADKLPPLDILMVWHAYMLNPRDFWQDCSHFGKEALWKTALPWNHIHSAIHNQTWTYTAVPAARSNFTKSTGLPWDLYDAIRKSATNRSGTALAPSLPIHCPYCSVLNEDIPLVGTGQAGDYSCGWTDNPVLLNDMRGWRCKACERVFNRDNLAAKKWKDDVTKFLESGTRLPGMYAKGDSPSHQEKNPWLFNFISILLHESCSQPRSLAGQTTLRDIESHLISHAERDDFRTGTAKAMDVPAEISNTKWANAIAAILENYTDNPTHFTLDLRHATIRQSNFVAKMHTLLWIRAPSLPHTLSKSLDRYKRFVHLLGSGGRSLVPTLDIDLVWHTHQLCPPFYNLAMLRDTGKFINHDDRMVPAKLDTDFRRCSEQWLAAFGEEYGGCFCWQCEQYSAAVAELAGLSPGDGGAVVDWRERVVNSQLRCEEVIQGLPEEDYAAFVGDVRVTTKWYRDVEIGRQARLRGESVPCLRRDGLREARKGFVVRAAEVET
ncbi:MAG: hypothetical protein M1840_008327 [Geoglossum simile]|nr:MAG: hypothetical protein M1840_008327 [Geoglossum simile]